MFKDLSSSHEKVYIIAEIGQNHQGDFDTAKDYVQLCANAGADAVKFQCRDNKYLFDKKAYDKPYESENAFGETYGEHREALELTHDELRELRGICEGLQVDFMCTPFDEPSLEFLLQINVDVLKVASFDLGNLPFLSLFAKSGKPTVMSVGGGNFSQIKSSVDLFNTMNVELAILHCVSEYPVEFNRLGLDNITQMQNHFPDNVIGLSDHFNGILSGPIGFMKGARVFEKHVTLNRAWKGTDHSFALEIDGFRKFVRDIRRVPQMMTPKNDGSLGNEAVFKKLGKSIVAKHDLVKGDMLEMTNLSGKIFDVNGIPVRESSNLIGRKLKNSKLAGEKIAYDDFE